MESTQEANSLQTSPHAQYLKERYEAFSQSKAGQLATKALASLSGCIPPKVRQWSWPKKTGVTVLAGVAIYGIWKGYEMAEALPAELELVEDALDQDFHPNFRNFFQDFDLAGLVDTRKVLARCLARQKWVD